MKDDRWHTGPAGRRSNWRFRTAFGKQLLPAFGLLAGSKEGLANVLPACHSAQRSQNTEQGAARFSRHLDRADGLVPVPGAGRRDGHARRSAPMNLGWPASRPGRWARPRSDPRSLTRGRHRSRGTARPAGLHQPAQPRRRGRAPFRPCASAPATSNRWRSTCWRALRPCTRNAWVASATARCRRSRTTTGRATCASWRTWCSAC